MSYKVCVCGGAGGIGQPLSMLLAMDERIGTLCVQDINLAAVPAAGVAADLSHLEVVADVKSFSMDPNKPAIEQLEECLTGCHIVLVPAGVPRKPGMTRDDLFNINCGIAQGITEACAKFCPEAMLLLIVNPVNSVVPAMCELYKAKGLDPKRVIGITTLDVVRANKFVAKELGVKPSTVNVPVVGGHAGITILPLISQSVGKDLSLTTIKALDKRIQEAGTEVVQAKSGKGSATLSMAYAGARLAKAILSGWEGENAEECCYCVNDINRLPYFASKVTFGKKGVETVHPLGSLSDYEKGRLEEVIVQLKEEVVKGCQYTFSQTMKDGGLFVGMQEAPPDPILGTTLRFNEDTAPTKINLGVGAYRTAEGKSYILPAIMKAEELLLAELKEGKIDKEYTLADGPAKLREVTQALVFGQDSAALKENRIASAQALSGTGSLRLVAEFIKKFLPVASHTIFVSDPTWGNHISIFQSAGLTVETYPYWKNDERKLDFEGMMNKFRIAPVGSTVLLHACAHNPTGVDPSEDQWSQIVDVLLQRKLVPLVDSAYQGYASGSLDKDAFACRLMETRGLEMFVCQSFAKNLGLYGERIGMVHVLCKDAERAGCVLSQLKAIITPMYSSPPAHGANLVIKVLGDPALLEQWKSELKSMADRIIDVRAKLRKGLEDKGTPGTWNHVTDQIGMFSYTGLSKQACERLISQHHIYLLSSGRISLAGLNDGNLEHMVQAVHETTNNTPPPLPPSPRPPPAVIAEKSPETKDSDEKPKDVSTTPAGSAIDAARSLRSEAAEDASVSMFVNIPMASSDPIRSAFEAFEKDDAPEKLNLALDVYRDNEGKPYILPAVAKAEEALIEDMKSGTATKEYIPIDGLAKLKEVTQALAFGKDAASIKNKSIASVQALSGTGASRLAGEFIRRKLSAVCHTVYIPDSSWIGQSEIYESCGLEVKRYPFWKEDDRSFHFDAFMTFLKEVPAGSCILLNACAHNPSGVDPTQEQWQEIATLMLERQAIPIFDSSYQGNASGSSDDDAFALRLFESKGMEFFVCQSFSSSMGLYAERIGMLHVVCKSADRANCVLSQLKLVIRPMYSSPPAYGAYLVSKLLGEDGLCEQWKTEMKGMADRIKSIRAKLQSGLEEKGTPGDWKHLTKQSGLFSHLGLSAKVCEHLTEKKHIYLRSVGQISFAGLNESNVDYLVKAIDEAVRA